MREIVAIAKALSDESRLRALAAVGDHELCVCQIIETLGLSPATVSKHMNVLEAAGLVTRRRHGKWRYYRIAGDGASPAARSALAWALEGARRDPRVAADARKIRGVRKRDLEEISACYRS